LSEEVKEVKATLASEQEERKAKEVTKGKKKQTAGQKKK